MSLESLLADTVAEGWSVQVGHCSYAQARPWYATVWRSDSLARGNSCAHGPLDALQEALTEARARLRGATKGKGV